MNLLMKTCNTLFFYFVLYFTLHFAQASSTGPGREERLDAYLLKE